MYRSYPENLKYLGVELYASLEVKADACEECEQCLEKCPAGLNIPEMLKEVVEVFAAV
jgi:predicted aldo/keto reductase-like oxidoreductase